MTKKIIFMLCVTVFASFAMDDSLKTQFMKNGPALAATMTQQQKIEFMRNGRQVANQLVQQTIQTNKPIEKEVPLPPQKPISEITPVKKETDQESYPSKEDTPEPIFPSKDESISEDDLSTENELIDYAIKLSLDDNKEVLEEKTPNANSVSLNEIVQKIGKTPGKNITINYNVKIKQKVKNSVQNINIGKKNSNQ